MRLLVTGAAGFVGSAVAGEAVRSGHDVVGIVRPKAGAQTSGDVSSPFQSVAADFRDGAAMAGIIRRTRPDVVVHIGWSGVDGASRNSIAQINDNIAAACALVEACAEAGVRKFVGIGSQAEYGLLSGKVSEDQLPMPTSLYGAAKLSVQLLTRQLAAQSGLSFAWLRLFAAYGPGDRPHWLIPSLIETMLDGRRPKTTMGTQRWDYLYIDDVARGVLAVAETEAAEGVFNLGSGVPVPVRTVVEHIRDLAAPGMDLVFGEIPYGPAQIWHLEADVARLKIAAGWGPQVAVQAGLARTVAWHRERRRQDPTNGVTSGDGGRV